MLFGDEYCAKVVPGFDLEAASMAELGRLFQNAPCISRFHSSPDNCFIEYMSDTALGRNHCYKLDEDRMIEINDSLLREPVVIHSEVSDLISFQFVSSVKRFEFLGGSKKVHNLGPAIIVSALPGRELTYRVPKINEIIRHVVIYTTLSNLMERMGEKNEDYPVWLRDILEARHGQTRQRVLFLAGVHRELTWSFFHLPVSGGLLNHWMSAKFHELLSVGLQILKNGQAYADHGAERPAFPRGDIIHRATTILNREYANPPKLPELAQHLGISETHLKNGFKSLHGVTARQYVIARRIEAACLLLNENNHSVSQIADIVGYEDHSAFSRVFRRINGCTPKAWRRAHRY